MEEKDDPIIRTVCYTLMAIAFIMFLFVSVAKCQSIGLGIGTTNIGCQVATIQTVKTVSNLGLYASVLTDERDGNAMYFNSFDASKTHYSGFICGVTYWIGCGHNCYVNAGIGRIKESSYAKSILYDNYWCVAEAKIGIELLKFLDLQFGVNSFPLIMSGIVLKINK